MIKKPKIGQKVWVRDKEGKYWKKFPVTIKNTYADEVVFIEGPRLNACLQVFQKSDLEYRSATYTCFECGKPVSHYTLPDGWVCWPNNDHKYSCLKCATKFKAGDSVLYHNRVFEVCTSPYDGIAVISRDHPEGYGFSLKVPMYELEDASPYRHVKEFLEDNNMRY